MIKIIMKKTKSGIPLFGPSTNQRLPNDHLIEKSKPGVPKKLSFNIQKSQN